MIRRLQSLLDVPNPWYIEVERVFFFGFIFWVPIITLYCPKWWCSYRNREGEHPSALRLERERKRGEKGLSVVL